MPKPPPRYSVIAPEEPLPRDLTQRQALFALYALQEWECLPPRPDPYGPGFFYSRIHAVLTGLTNVSRQTMFRHLTTGKCLVCDAPIDLTRTTLDHLLARDKGGPDDPSNALMLCRPHNSSKGTKDLLEWWGLKGFQPLPRTVLCLYARIHWQHLGPERLMAPCPAPTQHFLVARMQGLPGVPYQIALIGATYAGCAFAAWLTDGRAHA
jgi:hypothetical protein